MTASERKKRYKRSRVLIHVVWCGKDILIGNSMILAVKEKNYAFNRRFFNRNLFM